MLINQLRNETLVVTTQATFTCPEWPPVSPSRITSASQRYTLSTDALPFPTGCGSVPHPGPHTPVHRPRSWVRALYKNNELACTVTLVSPTAVVTAAHCVTRWVLSVSLTVLFNTGILVSLAGLTTKQGIWSKDIKQKFCKKWHTIMEINEKENLTAKSQHIKVNPYHVWELAKWQTALSDCLCNKTPFLPFTGQGCPRHQMLLMSSVWSSLALLQTTLRSIS